MCRLLLKQALRWVCALQLVLVSVPASADIASAFHSLLGSGATVAVNQPGQYSSQARNAFVAGGLDVRFPTRAAPQIINVTPFRFQAGCGGISLAFGGFSFISGSEIENLIRSVAQNSVGMAVELVMTTLCGPCASVMQVMRNLALAASKNSLDSCRIAQQLVGQIGTIPQIGGSQTASETSGNMCGLMASAFGADSDATAAANSDCSNIGGSIDKMTNLLNGQLNQLGLLGSPQAQGSLCAVGATCNTIWALMNNTSLADNGIQDNIRTKLLIMNVLGTNLMVGNSAASGTSSTGTTTTTSTSTGTTTTFNTPSSGSGTLATSTSVLATTPGLHSYPATLANVHGADAGVDMTTVFHLFMCGLNNTNSTLTSAAQAAVSWYCDTPTDVSTGATFDLSTVPVWDCDASGGLGGYDAYKSCTNLVQVPLGSTMLAQNGYLPMVANLLQQGVDAVRNNQSFDSAAPGLIGLIQNMPVPVYQAINAAAVYPDAGADLIGVMSVEVAELLTYAHLRDIVHSAASLQKDLTIPSAEIDRIYTLMSGMRAGTMERRHELLSQITLQAQMMEQIRQLNIAMQREVMTPELLGSHNYGVAVSNAASVSSR